MWKLENRGDSETKPAVYSMVEKWTLPVMAMIYAVATPLNVLLSPLEQWLPFLFVTSLLGLFSYWAARTLLRFQKLNALTMRRETFDTVVRFFVGLGLAFAAMLLVVAVAAGRSGLPLLYGLALSAGMSLGAARQWELRQFFRPRSDQAV